MKPVASVIPSIIKSISDRAKASDQSLRTAIENASLPPQAQINPFATRDRLNEHEKLLAKSKELLNSTGIPKRYLLPFQSNSTAWDKLFSSVYARLLDPAIWIFTGKRGSGKTQLACNLILEFIQANTEPAKYLHITELFSEIKSHFGHGSEMDIINKYKFIPLLVLDEVHEKSDSDWSARLLNYLIDFRYANLLPTILILNADPASLHSHISDSILSRANQSSTIIHFTIPSFR